MKGLIAHQSAMKITSKWKYLTKQQHMKKKLCKFKENLSKIQLFWPSSQRVFWFGKDGLLAWESTNSAVCQHQTNQDDFSYFPSETLNSPAHCSLDYHKPVISVCVCLCVLPLYTTLSVSAYKPVHTWLNLMV